MSPWARTWELQILAVSGQTGWRNQRLLLITARNWHFRRRCHLPCETCLAGWNLSESAAKRTYCSTPLSSAKAGVAMSGVHQPRPTRPISLLSSSQMKMTVLGGQILQKKCRCRSISATQNIFEECLIWSLHLQTRNHQWWCWSPLGSHSGMHEWHGHSPRERSALWWGEYYLVWERYTPKAMSTQVRWGPALALFRVSLTQLDADLKMENILVGGFENEKPGSGEALVTKIADLGMSMAYHSITSCGRSVH